MRAVLQVVVSGWRTSQQITAAAGQRGGDAQVTLHDEHVETREPISQLLAVSPLGRQGMQLSVETVQLLFQGQQVAARDTLHAQEYR